MSQPHKHAALIKAWADGATIQYKDALGEWADCTPRPAWDPCAKYRIKPEPIRLNYRRYAHKHLNGDICVYTCNQNHFRSVRSVEKHPDFLGWIDDDWIEHIIKQ